MLGIVLAIAGILLGFRGVPGAAPAAPVVIAALVLARALGGLGMVGLGLGLLRIGERLWLSDQGILSRSQRGGASSASEP